MINKIVVPVAGSGTRFLPLSKAVTKEFLPLGEESLISLLFKEILDSGIQETFVVGSSRNKDLFKKLMSEDTQLKSKLEKESKKDVLDKLNKFNNVIEKISLKFFLQRRQTGDGGAVLFLQKYLKDNNFAVAFPDDVIIYQEPPFVQMMKVFKNMQRPVIGVFKVPAEKSSNYGVVKVEKIANRFYKILDIEEKPKEGYEKEKEVFVIVGRYIFTSDIFEYIKSSKAKHGELKLAFALKNMIKNGKMVYGYEIKGDWLECGSKEEYIRSFVRYALKYYEFKDSILKMIKNLNV